MRKNFGTLSTVYSEKKIKIIDKIWTHEDLKELLSLRYKNNIDWKSISMKLKKFSVLECKCKFEEICLKWMNNPWTNEEDLYLFSLLKNLEQINWIEIAIMFQKRSPEECKRRWNVLKDKYLTSGNWGHQEQIKLFQLVRKYGFAWKKICIEMPLRNSNLIKGFLHASFRQLKNKRKVIFWFLNKIVRWPSFTNSSKLIIYFF